MDINSFPTDSLWKFMALTGLVLFVFNGYYSTEMKYQLSLETVEITHKQNLLKGRYKALKLEHDTLTSKYESILKHKRETNSKREQHNDKYRSIIKKIESKKGVTNRDQYQVDSLEKAWPKFDSSEEPYLALEKETDKISKELEQKREKLSEELDLIELEGEKLSLKLDKMRFYSFALLVGSILGAYFMIMGFAKWYVLQQATDNRIIKKERPESNYDL